MSTRIENNNIIITTNLGGIDLYMAHENNLKEYQAIIDSNIKEYRRLSKEAEKCKNESQKRNIYALRRLYDRLTFYIYSQLEISEVIRQLYLAESDIMKIYYINQTNLTLYKIIEKYSKDNEDEKYEDVFKKNDIPVEILATLNSFIYSNKTQLKKVRDKIAAHLEQDTSFTKLNDNLFSKYNANETAQLLCNFLTIWKIFLDRFYLLQITYTKKYIATFK